MRPTLLLVSAGSAAMAGAAIVAARSVRRRRPAGPSRGASVALETFWITGTVAILLFGLDALLLALETLTPSAARALGALDGLAVSVALGSLSYALGYLLWGTTRHLAFVAFGAGALCMAMVDALSDAADEAVTRQLLLHVLLRASGGFGLAVGALLLALSFACAVVLMRAGRQADDPAARRRGVLFGGGLGLLALAPLAVFGPIDGVLALGLALLAGAAAVLVGHQR